MQTFLPFKSFVKSAAVLDRARLGKQRVEAKQILQTLLGESQGWRNHPAVRMWRGYPRLLALYGWVICDEWRRRGYKDTLQPYFRHHIDTLVDEVDVPFWLGLDRFHDAHKSKLVQKDPEHYIPSLGRQPELEYYWPV